MPTRTPFTDHPTLTSDTVTVVDGGPSLAPTRSALLLRMNYADPHLAVLTASGELDTATAPRLAELLWPRLVTTISAIVLDLRELSFLGVTGLKLLASAHTYAQQRGIALSVVSSTHTVDHALTASGLDTSLTCFTSVDAARAATPTGAAVPASSAPDSRCRAASIEASVPRHRHPVSSSTAPGQP